MIPLTAHYVWPRYGKESNISNCQAHLYLVTPSEVPSKSPVRFEEVQFPAASPLNIFCFCFFLLFGMWARTARYIHRHLDRSLLDNLDYDRLDRWLSRGGGGSFFFHTRSMLLCHFKRNWMFIVNVQGEQVWWYLFCLASSLDKCSG